MKGEGGKGVGKDWAEILRGAFQVKGFTGVPPGLEKKKRQEKKASPKDHYAKQPRWSKGYGEEKKIIVFCYQKQHGPTKGLPSPT